MTRVAAYDCGTNSLRLLVADLDPATGAGQELFRDLRIVRLGQDVDRTGRIAEEAMTRVLAAVEEFAAIVAGYAVDTVRFCATSAARDAANAAQLMAGVEQRAGVRPEVLDGAAEARASYAGATRALDSATPGPWLVVDIGGGSTELILGEGKRVVAEHSLDIGSVRLTERWLASDPPTAAEIAAAIDDIDATLDGGRVDPGAARTVVGVAGTVTTVAAAVLGLAHYDRASIHGARLRRDAVDRSVASLLAMTVAERLEQGYLHPGRADVIGAGALILDRVLRRTTVEELLVSESDILDGIAWDAARHSAERES